jgi:Family of unknown function (DUF6178)
MPTNALDRQRPSHLLERLLDTPNLPEVVRKLDPAILHRLVDVVGLEDCGEIVSLATPAQLMRVFDADLWRSDRSGGEEKFDPDRFGLWLEVLIESGASNAALKVAGLDIDFVTSAILQHVVVVDQAAESAAAVFRQIVNDSHEEEVYERPSIIDRIREGGVTTELAGYAIVAKRSDSWDALVALLAALHDEHQDFFHRLMSSCCSVSAKQIEDESGSYQLLHAPEQLRFDVAFDREQRREGQGYVSAPQAAAFLQTARRTSLRGDAVPACDAVTRAYFRELERQPQWSGDESSDPPRDTDSSASSESGIATFMETLREAGVVTDTPRALLAAGNVEANVRRSTLTEHMKFISEHDEVVFSRRTEELGYLANVLVAGCSFNSGQFSRADAQDAVVATCNLGLENWPRQWLAVSSISKSESADADAQLLPDFLVRHDLVTVFRVGWTVLYERVGAHVARRLIEILSELSSDDCDLHDDLRELCRRLHKALESGTPWHARDHLDVIAILDTPCWAALLRLLDECPVLPTDLEPKASARVLRVSTDFSFISENRQIALVRKFLEELPGRLVG